MATHDHYPFGEEVQTSSDGEPARVHLAGGIDPVDDLKVPGSYIR